MKCAFCPLKIGVKFVNIGTKKLLARYYGDKPLDYIKQMDLTAPKCI